MLDSILNSPFHISIEATALIIILIGLEAVLSADNAIALAALCQGLDPKLQQKALNFGLLLAYVFRIILILTATWVIKFWQFQVIGALYLLWLVWNHFRDEADSQSDHKQFSTLWQAIPVIAITDLAFSLDSVTTAIAISDQMWLVITGGTIGVITLRLMAGLFIKWLNEYTYLETAGYITVGLVGIKLLLKGLAPNFVPPEWIMISAIALLFIWGFSRKQVNESQSKL